MTKKVLEYAIRTVNDGHDDFLWLIDLNKRLIDDTKTNNPNDSNFLFTFRECHFLRQSAIAYLGAISTLLKDKGYDVLYSFATMKDSVLKMLKKDGFLSSNFGARFSEDNTISADAIRFTSFRGNIKESEELSVKIVKYIQEEWLKDSLIEIRPKLKSDLTAKMYELFANALEHAQSPVGCFSCGQSYNEDKEIVLTIVDLGIGIVKSVQDYFLINEDEITEENAIKWALKSGNTTRLDNSGGLGLSLIYDFLKINSGSMDIYCNSVFLRITQGKMKVKVLPTDFSGTMINIRMTKQNNVRYGYQNEFKD